jgi:hypothetical protein
MHGIRVVVVIVVVVVTIITLEKKTISPITAASTL